MYSRVRIKDHYAEQKLFARRAIVSGGLIFGAILVLVGRLIYLQIIQHDHFLDLSQGNRIRTVPLPPNRGMIFDRNGVAMGLNAPAYQLELVREQTPNLDDTLKRLADLQLIDGVELPRLKKDILSRRSFEAVPISLQLSDDELARFAVRRQDFPGVEIQPRVARYYPLGASSVHALGYVSAISTDDQKAIDMDEYAGTFLIGKSGVERKFEPELHGKTGFQELLVNAQGRRIDPLQGVGELRREEPIAGRDLYLTIDHRVQKAAEEMMRGRRGAAVAIDPTTGDIIALVSMPTFDPNLFSRGISRADYQKLNDDPDIPQYNRALRGEYPPGSTIKPFMGLAALNYGVVTADDARFCGGRFRLPGVTRPWRDFRPEGHGNISLRHAIEQSCDVYFYGVADLLGIDRIAELLDQFGFGKPTDLDVGGERSGTLPSTAWKRRAFRTPEQQRWYPGETVNVGIGQGYLTVTPIQLAHATSIIASRGKRFQPRLVQAVRDPVSGEIHKVDPVALPPVALKEAYWDAVIEGMHWVTQGSQGTARGSASYAQYEFAGKTGTAQAVSIASSENIKAATKLLEERQRDHAWFVAFAPLDNPKLAVAVIVENGGQGGSAAAPVARRIFDTYLLSPEALKEQDAKGHSPGLSAATVVGAGE